MATRAKKILWFGVSTSILLLMVFFADVNEVLSAFAGIKLRYFSLAVLFGLSTFLVFAFTWYRTFHIVGEELSYIRSLRIYLAGEFLNSVTPVGQLGGEPFMAYVIRENSGMKYEEALSTVLSADIINTVPAITFVLGGFIYLMFFGSVGSFLLKTVGMVVLAVIIGSTITYLLWYRSGTVETAIVGFFEFLTGTLGRGERYVDMLEERMEGVIETFESIGAEKSTLVSTALVAHSFFVFGVLSLYFVMLSLGVETDITTLIFVVAFSGASNFIPTPGGSGAFEATMAFILTLFLNVSFPVATAAAILFRASSYWPIMVIGYLSLLTLEGRD